MKGASQMKSHEVEDAQGVAPLGVLSFPARYPGLWGLFWEERHKNEFQTQLGSQWASVAPTWAR